MTLMKALLTYLKLKDEGLTDFAQQIRKLSDADKAWLRQAFIDNGIAIVS